MYDSDGNPIQKQENNVTKTAGAKKTLNQTERNIRPETSRRRCPLSNTIIEMLVKQLGCEMANHNLYKTFANYFATEGLNKLETYWNGRADEEMLHHSWIFGYLTENDAVFQYPPIPAINVEIKDRITPFEATVDREIETTMGINKIADQALKEGDWATFAWLNGDDPKAGRLVMEQVEEEATSRTALDIAREEGSWLRKEKSILSFYTKS